MYYAPCAACCEKMLLAGHRKRVQVKEKDHDSRVQPLGFRAAGTTQHFLFLPTVLCRMFTALLLPFLSAVMTFESTLITMQEYAMLPTSLQPCVVDSAVFQLCPQLPHPLNIHIFVHFETKRKAER